METMLMVVTIISVAGAVALSVIGWSLLRSNRHRSDVRVAALEALAFDEPVQAPAAPAARFASLEDAPVLQPIGPRTATLDAAMFAAAQERGAPSRRWIALAAVALVMAGGVDTAYSFLAPRAEAAGLPPSTPDAAAAPAAAGHPLVLLSLKHDATSDSTFTVTGLVQNPADGQPLQHVEAVVYLFDDQGNYFAMGRSALEFRALQPGEDSPFVVSVPNAAHVGRYRVGFRLESGGAVPHVDRRGQKLAGLTAESGS